MSIQEYELLDNRFTNLLLPENCIVSCARDKHTILKVGEIDPKSDVMKKLLHSYENEKLFHIAVHCITVWELILPAVRTGTPRQIHEAGYLHRYYEVDVDPYRQCHLGFECKPRDFYGFNLESIRACSSHRLVHPGDPYPRSTKLSPSHCISKTVQLRHASPDIYPFLINIHVCTGELPKATIFRQLHTAVFVTICGDGIFIANASNTLNGISQANTGYLSLENKEDMKALKRLVATVRTHGIKFHPFHGLRVRENVDCGHDIRCPAMIRSSGDRHSVFAAFRDPVLGLNHRTRGPDKGITWSLGTGGCDDEAVVPHFFVNVHDLDRSKRGSTTWCGLRDMNTS
ncbi:hypothetical protein B0H12DRAFT_1083404 [Mycena haematopus]|nr:hypothetical protein B0H12DRAFT_1083404 [Mycena haematopus]